MEALPDLHHLLGRRVRPGVGPDGYVGAMLLSRASEEVPGEEAQEGLGRKLGLTLHARCRLDRGELDMAGGAGAASVPGECSEV